MNPLAIALFAESVVAVTVFVIAIWVVQKTAL